MYTNTMPSVAGKFNVSSIAPMSAKTFRHECSSHTCTLSRIHEFDFKPSYVTNLSCEKERENTSFILESFKSINYIAVASVLNSLWLRQILQIPIFIRTKNDQWNELTNAKIVVHCSANCLPWFSSEMMVICNTHAIIEMGMQTTKRTAHSKISAQKLRSRMYSIRFYIEIDHLIIWYA